jgi:putative acetyltransferase
MSTASTPNANARTPMTVVIDYAEPQHRSNIEEIQRRAFGRGDEVRMVRQLRKSPSAISLVASVSGILFGHNIVYPIRVLQAPDPYPVRIGGIGPVAVDPDQQSRGIGTRLVEEALLEAKAVGFDAVIADGASGFWQNLGFRPAASYGIHFQHSTSPDDLNIYWLSEPYRSSERVLCNYPPECVVA